MSMTDTNREARRSVRSVGRDLRFAGTVAAGLVAGVLGIGALSAPLLGLDNSPGKVEAGANAPVFMQPAQQRRAIAQPPHAGSHAPTGPVTIPVIGSGTELAIPTVATGGVSGVVGG